MTVGVSGEPMGMGMVPSNCSPTISHQPRTESATSGCTRTVTSSPGARFITARAMGDVTEMRPCFASASYSPTIV